MHTDRIAEYLEETVLETILEAREENGQVYDAARHLGSMTGRVDLSLFSAVENLKDIILVVRFSGIPAAKIRKRSWWKDYRAYLESDEWAARRKLIIERDGNACHDCETGLPLQVHHLTYARVGNEDPRDLLTLCKQCHKARHR